MFNIRLQAPHVTLSWLRVSSSRRGSLSDCYWAMPKVKAALGWVTFPSETQRKQPYPKLLCPVSRLREIGCGNRWKI